MKRYFLAILLMLVTSAAQATIIAGDFRSESNLPGYRGGQALVYQHVGASVGNGAELTARDFLRNPDLWHGGQVDVDLSPGGTLLTLKSNDRYDFQTFDLYLDNLSFDGSGSLHGIRVISDSLVSSALTPTLSFTDNGLHIGYSAGPGVFNFTKGQAQFELLFDTIAPAGSGNPLGGASPDLPAAVPEPSTLLLLGIGLAGLGAFGRKSRKA